jgi:hypothetical protein
MFASQIKPPMEIESAPLETPDLVPNEIPPGTPKERIRRVGYLHSGATGDARAGFATFLSQAARSISKRPLFLRTVLIHEVSGASDPEAVYDKARVVGATAIFAVVEGLPQAKIDALAESFTRNGVVFRVVPPADAQKKSTTVDIIVDLMLLPGEK